MKISILILISVLAVNPVFADQILKREFVKDQGISVGAGEKLILSSGSLLELTESRFEEGASQILINGTLLMNGEKDKPAIITFSERAFDFSCSKIRPINIYDDTLLYLPERTTLIEYTPRKYNEKGFADEINNFIFNAAKFYPVLFFLAAAAVSSR